MNKTYNVTLDWDALWEVRTLLEEYSSSLREDLRVSLREGWTDYAEIFKYRLDKVKHTLDQVPEL